LSRVITRVAAGAVRSDGNAGPVPPKTCLTRFPSSCSAGSPSIPSQHRKGLGRALFRDAGLRVLQAADIIGVRGLLVDAISDDAKAFYLALGMTVSPLDPMTLMVTLADLRASYQQEASLKADGAP